MPCIDSVTPESKQCRRWWVRATSGMDCVGMAQWTRQCLLCQRSKVTTHIKAPLVEYTPPSGRFAHVNINLVGPMALSNGFTYVLTAVDRFTRWPMAITIPDKAAMMVARAFL
jgi:hypothetical protein